MHVKQIAKNLGVVISKNSPTILTGTAVAGLITTAIFAVKATPKALRILEDEGEQRWENSNYDEDGSRPHMHYRCYIKPIEQFQLTWKCYIPTAAIATASIVCIIGANSINLRRNAALASVYTITETAFKEYQSKVAETIGKNKELKVRDELASDHIKANPPEPSEVIFTGKGEVLCFDSLSGRYFKHDIENIRRIENRLNKMLINEDHISLNDLYFELGLAGTKMGDDLGWHIETGMLEFRYSSQLTEDEIPCLVLDYSITPTFYY